MLVIPSDVLTFLKNLPSSEKTFVVGVSGGADSLYLTYLLAKWCQKTNHQLLAVTVNHNLRPEAKDEAEWVHKQLTKYKIHHEILTWEGTKPSTRIEEKAREKRYELLFDFCRKNKAKILFLAHHQQDQVETFWTRLARGSGLDGLCSMAQLNKRQNILIVRPLLSTTKQTILEALKKNHLKWMEDPMNQDSSYERVRWRKGQAKLDEMGLNSSYITKSITRLQYAKEALDFYATAFLNNKIQKHPQGFISVSEKDFVELPIEMRIRVLTKIFKMLAQTNKILSLESVEKIAITLPKYATLAGCQWIISHKKIFVAPELKYLKKQSADAFQWIKWGTTLIWTNKPFKIEAGAPTPRIKNIPFLVQRTFLKVPKTHQLHQINSEKELEKNVKLNYKDKVPIIVITLNERKENE